MSKTRGYSEEATRFSRHWWLGVGRSLLWIGVVTVLIWVYADMSHTDIEQITATVVLTTGGDKNVVILSKPDIQITFKVGGSRSQLDRFKRKYANSTLPFDVSRDYKPGKNLAIPTLSIVRQTTEPEKLGLEVRSVWPDTITGVHMDRLVLKELPVELAHTGATLVGKPKIVPENAKIRVTQTAWARILKVGPNPVVKTENLDLKQIQPGQTVQKDLKLVASVAGEQVVLVTKTANVTVKVAQHTDTKKLTVSVFILAPPEWAENDTWEKYILVRKDKLEWRPVITVTGTKADLETLEEVKKEVQAYIVLTQDDLKPRETVATRDVQIRFPQELRLKLVGEKPKVSFQMKPRGAAPAPP
ncbi:MAG: hypothetical protein ISS78_10120 [Phycisphaerae bacterium]|nr:hypothetical protein [Phycisphaerae bacterium]